MTTPTTGTTPVETITLNKKSLLQYRLIVKQQFYVILQFLEQVCKGIAEAEITIDREWTNTERMIQASEPTKEGD